MKKIILLSLVSFLSFSSVFATIEDNSILEELDKTEIKTLDVDFKLKSFESCEGLENVM
jgi:hypothetical protein